MTSSLRKRIVTAIGVIILLGGIAAGLLLIQQDQDVREKAATQN